MLQISHLNVLIAIIIGFLVVYGATPKFAQRLKERNLTAVDMHKPSSPMIPSMGGLVIVTGYLAGVLWSLVAFPSFFTELAGVMSTMLMISMLGMIDDILQLRHGIKVLLPIVASLPLVIIVGADRVIMLPFVGLVKVGVFYPLLLVPIGIVASANLTNMLAGFNGLETGMGLIAVTCLSISAFLTNNLKGMIVLACMIGPLLAFLSYNRYPSRIFPGNSGTYAIGAVIAAGVIVGDMEVLGIICLIPYIAEFFIKARTLFKGQCFGLVNEDGTLSAPSSLPESLTHVMMGLGRFSEPKLVKIFYLMEAVFGGIAILVAYLSIYYILIPS